MQVVGSASGRRRQAQYLMSMNQMKARRLPTSRKQLPMRECSLLQITLQVHILLEFSGTLLIIVLRNQKEVYGFWKTEVELICTLERQIIMPPELLTTA